MERNNVSVGTRCALRSLEPRCICGVYSSGTEHPWRSLADRSLIVCFIFSHDSHLDLNVAQTLSQEPRWGTSREQRIHCAYIRYVSVHRFLSNIVVTYRSHCNSHVRLPFGEHSRCKQSPDSRVEARNGTTGTRSTLPRRSDDTDPVPTFASLSRRQLHTDPGDVLYLTGALREGVQDNRVATHIQRVPLRSSEPAYDQRISACLQDRSPELHPHPRRPRAYIIL